MRNSQTSYKLNICNTYVGEDDGIAYKGKCAFLQAN